MPRSAKTFLLAALSLMLVLTSSALSVAAEGAKPGGGAPGASPPGRAPVCGGVAGFTCPAGLVCRMEGQPHPDQMGTCVPRQACPRIYRPVCAQNGRTFPNACEARAAGQVIDHAGACTGREHRPGTVGSSCAGFTGRRCNPGLYCFQTRRQQDMDDGAGVCRDRPQVCTRELRPVCGDNGRTYPNPCEAARAGINVRGPGVCLTR